MTVGPSVDDRDIHVYVLQRNKKKSVTYVVLPVMAWSDLADDLLRFAKRLCCQVEIFEHTALGRTIKLSGDKRKALEPHLSGMVSRGIANYVMHGYEDFPGWG